MWNILCLLFCNMEYYIVLEKYFRVKYSNDASQELKYFLEVCHLFYTRTNNLLEKYLKKCALIQLQVHPSKKCFITHFRYVQEKIFENESKTRYVFLMC